MKCLEQARRGFSNPSCRVRYNDDGVRPAWPSSRNSEPQMLSMTDGPLRWGRDQVQPCGNCSRCWGQDILSAVLRGSLSTACAQRAVLQPTGGGHRSTPFPRPGIRTCTRTRPWPLTYRMFAEVKTPSCEAKGRWGMSIMSLFLPKTRPRPNT